MKRHTLLTLAAVLLLATGLVAAAGPGRGSCADCPKAGPGFGPPDGAGIAAFAEHRAERLADALDLTEDQQAAWKTLRDDLQATITPLAEQAQEQHTQLRDLLDAGTTDAQVVGELVLSTHAIGQKIQAARDATEASFRALLTSEQLAKYDELQTRRDEHGSRHGHRGPGGRGR
ncbi:MAG: Spy/CpxP family protein refolding chaperone [Acidobacteria bacterium]|nr:Spy/CpxP family protein refolding chaperone [Acidobacteriota bacterium]